MTVPTIRCVTRAVLSFGIVAFAGCAGVQPAAPTSDKAAVPKAGATTAPARAVNDFSAGLRCMDNLLLDYGVRDLALRVEELSEPNVKSGSGSRGLLAAAVSDMTKRSRAIRLVAPDTHAANAPRQAHKPQYVLRGSIERADGKLRGVDLTMLVAHDLTVAPGIASRNQIAQRGTDGDTQVRKFGIDFSIAAGPSQDERPALRVLVELSTIELFGRLAKVPYWSCLGATDDDPEVASEIRDWYDTMAARPNEIIEYFQVHLRERGLYDGPDDGIVNAQMKGAVARYREALGLSREPKLSHDFFKAHLRADQRELQARLSAPVAAAPPSAAGPPTAPSSDKRVLPAAPATAAPLVLRIGAAGDARQFERGEKIQLTVKPSRDAHVYCFLQDDKRQISRFFPNRFQPDSRVGASTGLQLPGSMRFEISMNAKGVKETVSCFATERDVMPALPGALTARDFAPLAVGSLDQVRDVFAQASGGALAHDSFQVRPK